MEHPKHILKTLERGWLLFSSLFLVYLSSDAGAYELFPPVRLSQYNPNRVVIDNGICRITFAVPGGDVLGITYKSIANVLESLNANSNRGYWDVFWKRPGGMDIIDGLQGRTFTIIRQDDNQVEISFSRKWDSSKVNLAPLNVDKRYIVRRGVSGFYAYAILEKLNGWPDVDIPQIRMVFKLQQNQFRYMSISDTRQRVMPMAQDRLTGQPLAYPEAVLLSNPEDATMRGEVDDKYQYSCENKDNKVHGFISRDPPVGFWMITPSNEFRGGGPVKQDLTSHAGAIVLGMFTSVHYAGLEMAIQYRNGEPWKKVFGPAFIYLNSARTSDPQALWDNAKNRMLIETKNWPYDFVGSPDFPTSFQRGAVVGQLLVQDKYTRQAPFPAVKAYVGLAPPGVVGSWQIEAKGYQFWTQSDDRGHFVIRNIRAGIYNLYAWVPGFVGDYRYHNNVYVQPGTLINLGSITFTPPRNGPTLWEIGYPDRTASEFFVPEPSPTLVNRLFINKQDDRYRQYGLWDRYSDIYPNSDLKFTVGRSSNQDWFYAQVNRALGNGTYAPTTWQIGFSIAKVYSGNYTLQLALASATMSILQVRVNSVRSFPIFSTGTIGRDNAIARHGIHGLYRLFSISVPNGLLVLGQNTFYITQRRSESPFFGVMYDYLRLEAP